MMKHRDHPALLLMEELLAVPAPSGREERVAALLSAKLLAMGYAPETDQAGNLLVRLPGRMPNAPLCIIAAHMDEIGLVVTRIETDGRLRVARSGGLSPHKLGEHPMTIMGDCDDMVGVLSFGTGHAAAGAVSWDDAWILTGLSPAQLHAAGIRVGSTAVPITEGRGPIVFGDADDPLIGAWTFDDRLGVVTLLRALTALRERGLQPHHPTIVAFTVHEEGGAHGAKVLAQRERPDTFIAIDGCPIAPSSDLKIDGRPAAWSKDGKTHFDQRLIGVLQRAAAAAGTELQVAVLGEKVFSDASAVYDCGAVARVATFGHPRENSHGYEVARLSVCDTVLATLLQFIQTWQGE